MHRFRLEVVIKIEHLARQLCIGLLHAQTTFDKVRDMKKVTLEKLK